MHKMRGGEYRAVDKQILRWRKRGKKKFVAELKEKNKDYKEVKRPKVTRIKNIFQFDED